MSKAHSKPDFMPIVSLMRGIVVCAALILCSSVSFSQTITTGTITGSPFCAGSSVSIPYTASGIFVPGNTFTAQLSNAAGSFASPVTLGSVSSVVSGTITGTIPFTQAAGSGYLVRVISNSPSVTGSSSSAITINPIGINQPTVASSTFCAGETFTITYTVANGCDFPDTPSPNVFTAQLSNAAGTFGAPVTIGTVTSNTSGTITAQIPYTATGSSNYRVRITSSNPSSAITSGASIPFTVSALSIDAPTFAGTSFCAGSSFTLNYTVPCEFPNTPSSNVFTAQLSSASGSFASPTAIGSVTASTDGAINVTIPSTQANGSGYRIRVVSSNPAVVAGADNGVNLTISALSISAPTFAGTTFCAGSPSFTINYTVPCDFPDSPTDNVFTAQLSAPNGSFTVTTDIGSVTSNTSGSINVSIPPGQAGGTQYRIRVVSSNPSAGINGANNGVNLTITPLSIAAPTFTGSSFCAGTSFTLNYTVPCDFPNTPSNNVFTAQLSGAGANFSTPTDVGSVVSNTSGSITVTIPVNQASANNYRIRVVSSNPGTGVIGANNGANFTITALSINAPTIAGTSFCPGQAINVNYVVPGSCNLPNTPANNVFTAQLSDAAGAFGSPTNIGSLTASGSGTIPAVIPITQPAGSAYRIRVVSSNPSPGGLVSPVNGANLTINTLALNAPTGIPATVCQNQTFNLNYSLASGCSLPNTPANNVFTAQLSNASGSFASPVTIGSVTAASGGTMSVTIPVTTPGGTGYRIRVISSNPTPGLVSPDNGSNITVNVIGLAAPTIATTICQGGTYNVTNTLINTCGFVAGNQFRVELSSQFGSFASPVTIGTSNATTGGTISVTIPPTTVFGNAYRIRVVGTTPGITSPDNGANITINTLGINAPAIASNNLCAGQNVNVVYTIQNSCGFPNSPANTFTAQLSNASGSFASPTTIGTLNATGGGTIVATIPGGTPIGTGYRIRVVSSNPSPGGLVSADNGSNISILQTVGNPAVFGDGAWNVYAYNSTNFSNYSGTYTENNVNFNTTTRWNQNNGPSVANNASGTAYQGCSVSATQWSLSYKRTNFTCGFYTIDIPTHDDYVTLIIDGTQVFQHLTCCDAHTNVWSGFLGPTSQVEIQAVNTGGPGFLSANFTITAAAALTLSPPVTICAGASTTLTVSSPYTLTYAWTPTTGLSPATGIGATVTATPAATTTYTATGTDAASGCTVSRSVLVTVSPNFTPTVTAVPNPPTICSGITTATLTAAGANTYSWSPATGLSATTGNVVVANPPSTTTYVMTASNGCTIKTVNTTVTVQTIPGSPATTTFGNNTWNVYNHANTTFSNYYGFYTENNLSFNTTTRWNAANGPSVANAATGLAYSGCSFPGTNYSSSFKRTNFTCDYYQIDIPAHDDNITLFIDGVQVFQHNGCCDAHTDVWHGFLGPTSRVEFQLINFGGPGSLQATFSPSTAVPLVVNPSVVICSGSSANLDATSTLAGVTYSWRNSANNTNLIASPNSASTTAGPLTANEVYTVTMTDAATTGCSKTATVPVTVNPSPATVVTPTASSTYCPGTPYTLTASGANTYTWSPATGLSATTGFQVVASPTVTTTYTVTGNNNCGSNSATSTITINPIPSPSTFPTGTWNVYGFNATNFTSYQGYYTDNGSGPSGYDFNTQTRWTSGGAPSNANATNGQAYLGCTMNANNISLSYKRTGFACGLYTINILGHDDSFALIINGTTVASHNGCCDTHNGIWTGVLNPSSQVEFQHTQGGGGSYLQVSFTPATFAASTSVWIGGVSTDWFNAANWCGPVPSSTRDAYIASSGPAFMPVITGAAVTRGITLQAGVTAGTFNAAIPPATLTTTGTSSLDVYDNWLNNGTYTANNGTINFLGPTAGNTIGNFFPTTFFNVTINKPAGITNNLGLMQAQNLALTNGIVTQTTALNILAGGTVTGASNSSYIDGQITKTGNTAFTFPVGKGGQLRPISISAPALATDNFTAQYFNTSPIPTYPNASRDASIDHVSNAEYWVLNRSGGTSNVDVTLSWGSNSGGVGDPSRLKVARWDLATARWKDQGNGGTTGTTSSGTIASAGPVTTFSVPTSAFTLATGPTLANPLPVSLVSFDCALTNGVVTLKWKTASEQNNDYFEIQRLTENAEPVAVGKVKGAGTTVIEQNYSFTDRSPLPGASYYRLKQVDVGGLAHYSEACGVNNDQAGVEIFPNPASHVLTVKLNGRTATNLTVWNAVGKPVNVPADFSDDKIVLSTTNLPNGFYYVKVNTSAGAFEQKVIIQK